MSEKKPLVILTGPTAAGKTKLSISLAKSIGGEIISADSMQVYRHMNIGSAKIKEEEKEGIPHHLIDILEPAQAFDIVQFQTLANKAIEEIGERGRIPIIVGGTGFYIQSVVYGIDFSDHDENAALRKELEAQAKTQGGVHALHERLAAIDPDSAAAIHENNVKRVIRAIEFYEENKRPISVHNAEQRGNGSPYNFCYFVLTDERAVLYERINRRVDEMIRDGLVREVSALKEMGCTRNMVSMQGLGYKEILDYLDGACTLEEAAERIKRDTRHFAKRQITWFKREKEVIWLDRQSGTAEEKSDAQLLEYMLAKLAVGEIIPPQMTRTGAESDTIAE